MPSQTRPQPERHQTQLSYVQPGRPEQTELLRRPYPRGHHRIEAVPSPQQQPYAASSADRRGAHGPGMTGAGGMGRVLLSAVLRLASWVARVGAWGFAALTVACAVLAGPMRVYLLQATSLVGMWMPTALSGVLVFETPFGGALRGDFVIASVVLFIIDWACLRKARSLCRR